MRENYRTLILFLSLCILGVLYMKYEPPVDPSKLIHQDEPLVIAHRGASTTAPENSLVSIEQAIIAGADLIEFDYFRADSNKMYVIHDAVFV